MYAAARASCNLRGHPMASLLRPALSLAVILVSSSAVLVSCARRSSAPAHLPAQRAPEATPAQLSVPSSCPRPPATAGGVYELRYDQLGYLPSAEKWAVVLSEGKPAPHYRILDAATFCTVGESTA